MLINGLTVNSESGLTATRFPDCFSLRAAIAININFITGTIQMSKRCTKRRDNDDNYANLKMYGCRFVTI